MTSIDRTIYRHVKRHYPTKELIEAYTPTEEELLFVETMTRTAQHQLNFMLWVKPFPCLGYFPAVDEIPSAIVVHDGFYLTNPLRRICSRSNSAGARGLTFAVAQAQPIRAKPR